MNAAPEQPGKAHHATHHHPFWRKRSVRHFGVALVFAVLVIGGAVKFFSGPDEQPAPRQVRELKVVKLAPPPPPPPPPPQPQKQLEEKMVEQPKMVTPEMKQDKPLDTAPAKNPKSDEPPGPLSLDAKGTGPGDLFGLGGKPGGSAYGIGGGGEGGGGGSKWGWYASIVQSQIESALRANRKTRSAVMRVEIRLWADGSGRISRVQLGSSTGDAELDAAIRNEVLGGMTLREPPPKDMPMPVVTRVTARRPGGHSELHRNRMMTVYEFTKGPSHV